MTAKKEPDTVEKATERYMRGGFGNLKTKVAYKRYAAYIERLLSRKPRGKL